ncbi:unnamed protein product [[Candida] boidinii]|nr:unnamed protein product [[Candida] boidinii]
MLFGRGTMGRIVFGGRKSITGTPQGYSLKVERIGVALDLDLREMAGGTVGQRKRRGPYVAHLAREECSSVAETVLVPVDTVDQSQRAGRELTIRLIS